VTSPVQYESAQTSDAATRGYPADCTALALPGGPSELTPTVTEVIFVRAWVLPLCDNARKPCGSNNWIYYRGGPEDVTGPIILCVYYYRTLLA
jgi:hypothetical protein